MLPVATHGHGVTEIDIDGKKLSAEHVMSATVPLNVTGLPGLSLRFGTTEYGMPIGVQLVSRWHAESTILRLGAQLEAASPVRGLHPAVSYYGASRSIRQAASPMRV